MMVLQSVPLRIGSNQADWHQEYRIKINANKLTWEIIRQDAAISYFNRLVSLMINTIIIT